MFTLFCITKNREIIKSGIEETIILISKLYYIRLCILFNKTIAIRMINLSIDKIIGLIKINLTPKTFIIIMNNKY